MKLVLIILLSAAVSCAATNPNLSMREQENSSTNRKISKLRAVPVNESDLRFFNDVCGVDIRNRTLTDPTGNHELSKKYEKMKEDYDRNISDQKSCADRKYSKSQSSLEELDSLRSKLNCLTRALDRPPRVGRVTSVIKTGYAHEYKKAYIDELLEIMNSSIIDQGHLLNVSEQLRIRISVQIDSSGQFYRVKRLKPSKNLLFDYLSSKAVCDMTSFRPFDGKLNSSTDLLDLVFSIVYMPNRQLELIETNKPMKTRGQALQKKH